MIAAGATAAGVRRRFIAPSRERVDRACFEQPLFAGMHAFKALLVSAQWPSIDALNACLSLPGKQLVEQDAALLADGLHYEQRIAAPGHIATRPHNWHDLLNALVWARYPAIKLALNAQQCLHVAAMGPGRRNRAQAALTQFDETGVIVRVRDAALLQAWDRQHWSGLFERGAAHWHNGDIAVAAVVGHALMEQALLPGRLGVGKCVVVQGSDDAACVAQVASAIGGGRVLNDPLELRPLPLAGIPGWHPRQDEGFYQQADYFRPLREGRVYPPPLA